MFSNAHTVRMKLLMIHIIPSAILTSTAAKELLNAQNVLTPPHKNATSQNISEFILARNPISAPNAPMHALKVQHSKVT